MRLDKGGIRLFKLFGIDVFLHWSWILVAAYELGTRPGVYSSPVWNVAEYLTVFLIVLMHEFGHALACRSVGGKAERIILWPLGGVAFVEPPPRPGAVLWSLAAGPLVNVVLVPVTFTLTFVTGSAASGHGDLHQFFVELTKINIGLAVFNLMPVYPLDGGQILRALLWFFLGPTKSLRMASFVGVCGSGAILVWALSQGARWMAMMAGLGAMVAWRGFKAAGLPRHKDLVCPACGASPPVAPIWSCSCGARFDAFETGVCPSCGAVAAMLTCPDCQKTAPPSAWPRHARAA